MTPTLMIIFFKAATLVVLICIILYAYIYYGRPLLQTLLDNFHTTCSYLIKAQEALNTQQQEIAYQAQQQKNSAEVLIQKIVIWQAWVQKEQSDQLEQSVALRQQRLRQHEQQQRKMSEERLRFHMIKKALDEVQPELIYKYQKPEQADFYIHTVIQALKE